MKLEDGIWNKCRINIPRRDISGKWIWPSFAQTWRRKRNEKWEYQQDDEPADDYYQRQV